MSISLDNLPLVVRYLDSHGKLRTAHYNFYDVCGEPFYIPVLRETLAVDGMYVRVDMLVHYGDGLTEVRATEIGLRDQEERVPFVL